MQEYTIDLTREPEDRWTVVDPAPVQLLLEEAEAELIDALPRLQLLGLFGAVKALKMMYRDSEYVREIAGLAEHASVSMDKLLLMNLSYDLASSGFTLPGMLGCTGALVRGGGTAIARTMDWSFPEGIRDHTTIYRFVSKRTHVLTAGFPGFIGVVSGLSSYGLALTLNQAFVAQLPRVALPVPWLVREILTQEKSFSDALDALTTTPAASGGFYLLTDGGQGALVESTGSEDLITRLHPGERYLAIANHFLDEEPDDETEREWGDTFERYTTLTAALHRHVSPAQALMCSPVEHGATAHQLLISPADMCMKIRCPQERRPIWRTYRCPSN